MTVSDKTANKWNTIPSIVEEGPPVLSDDAPNTINAVLEQRDDLSTDPRRKSLFPDLYYSARQKRLDWWKNHRVELTLTYDALVQGYSDPDENLWGGAGDLSLSGRWLIMGEKYNKPFYLSFRLRERHGYSEYTPSDIRSETDLLWGTVDGFNNSGFQIPDLFFRQELFDADLILRYGQFSIDKFVDKHSLRSAKRFFLNEAFSDNPTVSFPSYGAGFAFTWKPDHIWEATGGVSNIQGTEGNTEVDFGLGSSALFWTIQAAGNFKGFGGRSGRVQVMGWESDEKDEEGYDAGNGFSITIEHGGTQRGETYVARYAQSSGDSTDTDTIIFLGYNREIRGLDSFALGVGTGQSAATSGWQTVIEFFYRWQVTKELVVTPDVQIIWGDDLTGDSMVRFVGGIRAGIVF